MNRATEIEKAAREWLAHLDAHDAHHNPWAEKMRAALALPQPRRDPTEAFDGGRLG